MQEHYFPMDDAYSSYAIPLRDIYEYDALNRVTQANGVQRTTGGAWPSVYAQHFSYDRWGNRWINSAGTWGANIFNTVILPNSANNRLNGMSYDSAGNTTTDNITGGGARTYDADNRMTSAQSGATWNYYVYDADGKRVRRIIGSTETWMIYGVDGELVGEYAAAASATSPQKEYGYRSGQMLIAAETSPLKITWLVTDHLGTPRMNIRGTGTDGGSLASVTRHDYLPFGEDLIAGIRVNGGSGQNGYEPPPDGVRQKFVGYERDSETALDFARARCYANVQGRFSSVDPLLASGRIEAPQTWNRYAYSLNNPLRYIDPTGLFVWDTSLGGTADDKDVSKKIRERREQIRAAIGKANEALNSGKLNATQTANLQRALNAYGAEGNDNGVKLAVGKISAGAAAETSSTQPYVLYDQNTTDFKANITVTFKEGGSIDAETFAHEGSHVADRQELVAAFGKASLMNPAADWLYIPENIFVRQTESRAYRVSAAVAQGLGNSFNPGGYEVWNSGWREADRSVNMQKGISQLLKNSSLYKDKLNNRLIREK